MKKIKDFFVAHKIFKIFAWVFLILIGLFIILLVVRTFHYFNVQKTNDQVNVIHSTKLSLDDVTGQILPYDPGIEADKTIQGIDENNNGIRDDVELAIYKEYPNSAKTRAVLLQYALVLQMMSNQSFINEDVATSIMQEINRLACAEITINVINHVAHKKSWLSPAFLPVWLLNEWQQRFTTFCQSQKLFSSALLKDLEPVPFWYWREVVERLYNPMGLTEPARLIGVFTHH